jgi:hypothetical protein
MLAYLPYLIFIIPNRTPKSVGAAIYLEMPTLYFVEVATGMSMDRQDSANEISMLILLARNFQHAGPG